MNHLGTNDSGGYAPERQAGTGPSPVGAADNSPGRQPWVAGTLTFKREAVRPSRSVHETRHDPINRLEAPATSSRIFLQPRAGCYLTRRSRSECSRRATADNRTAN